MSKATKFYDLTDSELQQKLQGLKQELFNLRFQHSTGQLTNPKQLNTVKKDIARVKTILTERELKIVKISAKKKTKGVK